jgi:heme a synthase
MPVGAASQSHRLIWIFSLGSVISTYILILIGGYVTTSDSGLGCGESWPLCSGAVLPALNNSAQLIEFSHRIFNFVVVFFVIGTAIVVWRRYRQEKSIVLFITISFIALLGQIFLGMVTVTSSLNPIVSDAHLGLASAILALLVVNVVMVWNLRSIPIRLAHSYTG